MFTLDYGSSNNGAASTAFAPQCAFSQIHPRDT